MIAGVIDMAIGVFIGGIGMWFIVGALPDW